MMRYWIVVFLCLMTAGCSSSPFSQLERTEGPMQVNYRIQVPPGTGMDEMKQYAVDLAAQEGKSTMVNFYDGPRSMETFVTWYNDGTMVDVRKTNAASRAGESQ